MSVALPDHVRRFLDGPRHAVITTIDDDGSPQVALVWYERDGDAILLNSARGRRWPTNLLRDPRIAVVVAEGADWVSLRGRVTVDADPERALDDIIRFAHRYDPEGAAARAAIWQDQERITFRLEPERVRVEIGVY